jgi:hypothetical protein
MAPVYHEPRKVAARKADTGEQNGGEGEFKKLDTGLLRKWREKNLAGKTQLW